MSTNVKFESDSATIWQEPVEGNVSAEPAIVVKKLDGAIALYQDGNEITIASISLATVVSVLNYLQ